MNDTATGFGLGQCSRCEEPAIGVLNGVAACFGHIDDVVAEVLAPLRAAAARARAEHLAFAKRRAMAYADAATYARRTRRSRPICASTRRCATTPRSSSACSCRWVDGWTHPRAMREFIEDCR